MNELYLSYILTKSVNDLQIFIDICFVTQYLCSMTSLGILCRSIIVNMFLLIIYHKCLDTVIPVAITAIYPSKQGVSDLRYTRARVFFHL